MELPEQLSELFSVRHFEDYPYVQVPQEFYDGRGSITNIADGALGDVAIIRSQTQSIRANHTHEKDWHLSYLISGSMFYFWKDSPTAEISKKVEVRPGELIYTPPKTPHKMLFTSDSIFVAVAALSRSQEAYEADTSRLPESFFD